MEDAEAVPTPILQNNEICKPEIDDSSEEITQFEQLSIKFIYLVLQKKEELLFLQLKPKMLLSQLIMN